MSTKPRPFMVHRPDGNDVQLTNTLCYVDVLSADSNTPRRVWQREFAALEGLAESTPHSFALGPVDEQRFCLAFLCGFTLYSFTLDSRSSLNPKEDEPAPDPSKPGVTKLGVEDANGVNLMKLLETKYYGGFGAASLSVTDVCGFAESTVVGLRVVNQRVGLRCQRGEKKLTCQVFQLSEIAK